MPLIVTVIAYPREAGVWKMRLSGINDHQFTLLKAVNPLLKRKSYGTFLTAKWRTTGAGHGRYVPMSYITPVLNILESWGYTLLSVDDVQKYSGLGKIWTFKLSRYGPYYLPYPSSRWLALQERYACYYRHWPYRVCEADCCLPAILPPP